MTAPRRAAPIIITWTIMGNKKNIAPTICLILVGLLHSLPPTRSAAANWMYLGLAAGSSQSNSGRTESAAARVAAPSPPNVAFDHPSDRIRDLCNALPGLVSQQIEVCETQPNAIASVSEGARRALLECQFQFRHERWNCTTGQVDTVAAATVASGQAAADNDVFGYTLQRGSRETAFVYAVTSAGVVHAITQACSSGNLTECSCDISKEGHATPEGWKWGGCSDNVEHGLSFSRQFVDAPERIKHLKSQNVRNKMNLHNNEAGRKAIEKLMLTKCRCHGVSGSCELKTCWRNLPSFSLVGDYLKRKYANAVRVKGAIAQKRLRRQDVVVLPSLTLATSTTTRMTTMATTTTTTTTTRMTTTTTPTGRRSKMVVSKEDLVHIHKSPNYCVENRTKGILGTRGRVCNKTSIVGDANRPETCDLLCCGRGYNTRVVRHVERCNCKFIWCCYVKCKVCETMLDVHTCK